MTREEVAIEIANVLKDCNDGFSHPIHTLCFGIYEHLFTTDKVIKNEDKTLVEVFKEGM